MLGERYNSENTAHALLWFGAVEKVPSDFDPPKWELKFFENDPKHSIFR